MPVAPCSTAPEMLRAYAKLRWRAGLRTIVDTHVERATIAGGVGVGGHGDRRLDNLTRFWQGRIRMAAAREIQMNASIFAGDALDLRGDIGTAERAGADGISLDVSDGHFVPTISFGEEVVRRTCRETRLPVEVHLMVSRPDDWVERMDGCGHTQMIFHLEASQRAMGMVNAIRGKGVRPGIAINPETPADAVEPLLPYVASVCVMGIAPGFAGQSLLDYTFVKVARLRELIDRSGSEATITVDGGVKSHNAARLIEAGADVLVVSSGMYGHERPEESLRELRDMVAAG